MKHLPLLAIAIAITACSSDDKSSLLTPNDTFTRDLTFTASVPMSVTYEPMTRASLTDASLTDLWLLDYSDDGTLLQQVHQTSTDAAFGTIPVTITYGHHDVLLIASRGDSPSLTTSAITWGKVKDTFTATLSLDVAAGTPSSHTAQLQRAISGLKVSMTDKIPSDAKTLRLTLGSRSQQLSLPSLSALPYGESSVEFAISSAVGKSVEFTIYTLADADEWTSTASILALRADGSVLTSFSLPDVSLRRNRLTTLTGEVFNRSSGFSITVDDQWEADNAMTF